MNLPIITMDPGAAQKAFEDYRAAVKSEAEAEIEDLSTRIGRRRAEMVENDRAIMEGYRQLAKDRPIIDLRTAVASGGQDKFGRPRIAVARADDSEIEVTVWPGGRVKFEPTRDWELGERAAREGIRHARIFDFLGLFDPWPKTVNGVTTKVPYIPPNIRPRSLDRYHILFEAEWRNLPPADPALLRHLGAGLYLVVATWDLTDLEKTVLAGSMR